MGLNPYVETIIQLAETLGAEDRLFPFSKRWAEKVIEARSIETLGYPLTPYHFRHSCITHAAASGYSISDLMHLKGSKAISGVAPYLHASPMVIDLERQKRARFQAGSIEKGGV